MDFSLFTTYQYISYLEDLKIMTEGLLENAPEGALKINKFQGRTWYCRSFNSSPRSNVYIPSEDTALIKALAQKSYDQKILRLLNGALRAFSASGDVLAGDEIDNVYNGLSEERRKLVVPVIPTDEQYIEEWLSRPYEKLGFQPGNNSHFYTENDERVRSKAEIIIANTLKHACLPYIYEFPLHLTEKIVYPDFTILDIRTRKEKYLEHFGMMDDPEYVKSFVRKINLYERNGIYPGYDLLFTVESLEYALDTRRLKKLIDRHFFQDPGKIEL